ncbi:MAG: isoprenylcysteine carboxylmethyltransferase family protein [Melioribacter sp.]|nr:isoprenylcysteine carboxylmethyltransferase family protein [Melioribacter sp.]
MDPINILLTINLIATIGANWNAVKKGVKVSVTKVLERPSTYLQKLPQNVAALVFVLIIVGIFGIGNLSIKSKEEFLSVRLVGLIAFVLFSWLQIYAFKTLGVYYTQEIVILRDHKLIRTGLYRYIRHPQYFFQILSDLGAGVALLNYLVIFVVIFVELPLFVLRAMYEDKLLQKHFKEEFLDYKKHSGFFIPFIG